jgi:hypothetical protein
MEDDEPTLWELLYDEKAVERAERLVAAAIGSATRPDEISATALTDECRRIIVDEIGPDDGLALVGFVSSLAGLASGAIFHAGYLGRLLAAGGDVAAVDLSLEAAQPLAVEILDRCVGLLHEIRRTNNLLDDPGEDDDGDAP